MEVKEASLSFISEKSKIEEPCLFGGTGLSQGEARPC